LEQPGFGLRDALPRNLAVAGVDLDSDELAARLDRSDAGSAGAAEGVEDNGVCRYLRHVHTPFHYANWLLGWVTNPLFICCAD